MMIHRGKKVRKTDHLLLGPLTTGERKRGLRAIRQAKRLQVEMLAQRNGKLFGPSDEVLNELREERISSLSRED